VLFLIGLLLAPSCRFGNEPSPAADTKVVQVAKDERGLKLILENALTVAPAKVSALFKVRDANDMPDTTLDCGHFTLFEDNDSTSLYESAHRVKKRPEILKMRVLLLLDLSGSIIKHDRSLKKLIGASRSFVRKLLPEYAANVEIGVFWFDGGAQINQLAAFTTDTVTLQYKIASLDTTLKVDLSTNLNGAIVEGVKTAKSKTGKSGETVSYGALVLFTDGSDRAARVPEPEAVKAVDGAGSLVLVSTIGVGGEINVLKLNRFGRDGFFYAKDIDSLGVKFESAAQKIEEELASRYLVEYCSPRRKGKHELKITAFTIRNQKKLYGSLTLAYNADKFGGGCNIYRPCSR
jgi:hypothetical protein